MDFGVIGIALLILALIAVGFRVTSKETQTPSPKTSTRVSGIGSLLRNVDLQKEKALEDIHDILIMADVGIEASDSVIEELRRGEPTVAALHKILLSRLQQFPNSALNPSELQVILVVGVNGVGKTTSVGKLAHLLSRQGKKVVLAAGDTFRAAAVDQLQTWAKRSDVHVVTGNNDADPASVAFEAITYAKNHAADVLIVDTAGRLHTKTNLMDELGKVKRVLEKHSPVTDVLLVLDATTGQNGVQQAKSFKEIVDVSGLIITKLDGSAKGGVIFAIQNVLAVPIKFVGTGETLEDFSTFEPATFVDALLA
ncbi:MAG: signal recognition particle-docking protein FtsY [Candidatus Nanopelagicales bacterium]